MKNEFISNDSGCKRFLIKYVTGARGDFLASILIDKFALVKPMEFKIRKPDYIKVHSLNSVFPPMPTVGGNLESYAQMFDLCKRHNITTIRIKCQSDSDLLDCMYYSRVKNVYDETGAIKDGGMKWDFNLFKKYNFTSSDIEEYVNYENDDIDFLTYYDYTINFQDLFEIDCIVAFYNMVYNTNSALPIDAITENIKMNSDHRYTQCKYKYE